MMWRALLECVLISTAYVAPFYLQTRLSRSHTTVILTRFVSTALACAVAWLPLFFDLFRLKVDIETSQSHHTKIGLIASSGVNEPAS